MSFKGFRSYLISEAALAALHERAENNNVPVEVLEEVFNRGVVAWDESTQKTPSQYAFNRVDSFIAGGFAAKLDEDLLNELSPETMSNYKRKAQHVVDNTPEDSKVHKKSKEGIARADRLLNKRALKEDAIIRHPEHKKAYVKIHKAHGELQYKASNKHGNLKFFNKHGSSSALKHAGINEEQIDEVSTALMHRYSEKGNKSVHKLENEKFTNANDNKVFKRKMFLTYVKNKMKNEEVQIDELSKGTLTNYSVKASSDLQKHKMKVLSHFGKAKKNVNGTQREPEEIKKHHEAAAKHMKKAENRKNGIKLATKKIAQESNVLDNSGEEIKEGSTIERTKILAVKRRETRSQLVHRKFNERQGAMRDFHRTEMVLRRHGAAIKRNPDSTQFIDRQRHQLTNRWKDQHRYRINLIRNARNVKEGVEYIEARRKLHDAHHESSRLHAGMERDPELRRQDLHRAKKHKHASRVLEIILSKKQNKDKK